MIIVDTSVWIEAPRQPRIAAVLDELIDADEVSLALPVRLELWAAIAHHQRADFNRRFGALPQLHVTEQTWQPLRGWIEKAADQGHRFAIPDLLVASLADQIGGLVWSLDGDFERMERLELVSLYSPA
jgi:predicted nucleic acid-binding protein